MKDKMSRWGIGPACAAFTMAYRLTTLAVSYSLHPFFRIEILNAKPRILHGSVLLMAL